MCKIKSAFKGGYKSFRDMEMRERFRAWHIKDKEMQYGKELYDGEFGRCLIQLDGGIQAVSDSSIRTDSFILMRYLGVISKNKKEICEGDIIKSKLLRYDGVPIYDGYTSVVDFYHSIVEFSAESKDLEIIGNVFENKELL